MNLVLFDDHLIRQQLKPLTFTRPISELRAGILTLREKAEAHLNMKASWLTEDYLQKKFPVSEGSDYLLVNASTVITPVLAEALHQLKHGEMLQHKERTIAIRCKDINMHNFSKTISFDKEEVLFIENPWELFSNNEQLIKQDFQYLTKDRTSESLSKTNIVTGEGEIFIEENAQVEGAFINASKGPVYIGKDAEVMEGAKIRGPFAMCEHSVLKMDAKIYGATTLGPYAKIGGEVNNCVFQGYSNKAHDGFLGNSVIGEWCNLGADTNNSNLKNTYDEVKLWSYPEKHFINTGLQFCGLIMGDHSKCGINTMFNTGTVIGVNVNIFGTGFPRNFIPSFSWGGAQGFKKFNLKKAFQVADSVMSRRGIELDDTEKEILTHIYEMEQG
ncbi:MAG: GlmU family protein [Bacteroidales bacterium]|nr:GlmU family protein [Bacteroidales bacterium]MCF8327450.1 GlmU family protein [Bacteroidales bacterium]